MKTDADRARRRAWKKTPAGVASKKRCMARYRRTPRGRELHRAAQQRYRSTPHGAVAVKAARDRWNAKRKLLRDYEARRCEESMA